MLTDSSSVTRSARSCSSLPVATSGSGSQVPTYCSRRARAEVSASIASRDDRGQPRTQIADLRSPGAFEAKPCLLDDVFRLAEASEMAVGDAEEVRT
jgi:hypothetical protein